MDWEDLDQRDVFLQHFLGLCELFNVEASEFKIQMYFRALERFDIQAVTDGISKAITLSKFFPKPVELIEHIQGSPDDVAELEASKVANAVRRVGGYRSVAFDNPVTAAVVEYGFGGWVKLCSEFLDENEKWFRKEFCKTYASFARQNVQYLGELSGRAAISNVAHCKPHKEQLALIGNVGKAQAILAAGKDQRGSQITMLTSKMKEQLAIDV